MLGAIDFDAWETSVTVLRGGGRDARGNPQPETRIAVAGVLIGWRSTSDPVDRAEVTTDLAILYDQTGAFEWLGGDRVEIPSDYQGPRGRWMVDGTPKLWPGAGWEVPLRK